MAYSKEQRIVNNLSGSTKKEREAIAMNSTEQFVLPNESKIQRKPKAYWLGNTLYVNDATGRVGLGTESPVCEFHISTSGTPQIVLTDTDTNKRIQFLNTGTYGTMGSVDDIDFRLIQASQNRINLDSSSNIIFLNGGTELARITSAGNVGIGTDSPEGRLHLMDTATDTPVLYFENDNMKYRIFLNGANDNLVFRDETNTTTYFSIDGGSGNSYFNNGNVGIGTTSPNEALTLGADGVLSIDERASAPSATAAHGKLWVKNTNPCELWFTDDAGTSTQIV